MSDGSPPETSGSGSPEISRGIPRWKKVVVTCAAFLVVAGLGLRVAGAMRSKDDGNGSKVSNATKPGGFGANSYIDGGDTGTRDVLGLPGFPGSGREAPQPAADGSVTDYSPALLKGGLSFFVGFCVGYAVRTFLKVSFVVVGLVALAVFGLEYFGLIHVDMAAIEGHFDDLVGKVGDQASDFKSFISGSLPSAGMASVGLFTGVKRG